MTIEALFGYKTMLCAIFMKAKSYLFFILSVINFFATADFRKRVVASAPYPKKHGCLGTEKNSTPHTCHLETFIKPR